ncbi:hypothetical protein SAMN04488598_10660 [Halanaerobium congolense]|jgi:hypothetical protein|uniref:Uncharacterized protein n=1 Tax=Halanaerobium congolense TaxID=54121 RepID=A0A4R8GQ65_9FIRM|nr:hypothetical protein [Halanaerobium congolense]PTX17277.1 hypothetical protein C7953_2047 [Halanaerobium congolense]TDX45484.1 hypothetical protein C7954_10751 [Halanaerobium congolense]SDF10961.1 hypothetical protein SAMN04488598_10660 [Halanaerobium congolense]SES82033.1 hypothetical protein SAMN04515652_10743 [Halanaerobium congolense]SFO97297.1 hypothetical protein SAMN04488596_103138 [Halanaerobium congolense]
MNKAMLCTLKRSKEVKNVLIIKNKINPAEYNLAVDYQLQDTDPSIQHLINSQTGQEIKVEFLDGDQKWKLSSKKMYISNFDYAYDLSSLKDFIDSLILFKADDREIDLEIIKMLKDDIFTAAAFWENNNIDQDLTAELILKYWDLEAIPAYPKNDYYKMLLQFADNKIKTIDQKTADFWFDIPAEIRDKITKLINKGKINFKNYAIYLQTRNQKILNTVLFDFITEAADEEEESLNNLFEKFHYELIDELTKYALEKDNAINLNPVIPHGDSARSDLSLQAELEMNNYSLIEVFDNYSIAIDFENLNLFEESQFKSLAEYLKSLGSQIEYLNQIRKKLRCDSCGQIMDYELEYLQKNAVYKVKTAHCSNLECDKFEQEIKFK